MSVKSSTKPDAWTLSPQMTAAPELWRGVVFVSPLWAGASTIDYISPFFRSLTRVNQPAWTRNSRGLCVTGQSEDVQDTPSPLPSLTEATLFFHGRLLSVGDDRCLVHLTDDFNGTFGSNGFALIFDDDVFGASQTQAFRFRVEANGDVDSAWTDSGVGNTTDIVSIVARWRVGTAIDITVGGVEYSNNSLAMSGSVGADIYSRFSFNAFAADTASDSETNMIGFWSRFINDGDRGSLMRDPFAMLRPAGF